MPQQEDPRWKDWRGDISFSVKELWEQLQRRVDDLDRRLDDHSKRLAALEYSAVKREGPIIQEMRAYERKLENVANQIASFENGVGIRIQRAIQEANQAAQKAADRSFSRREKIVVGVFALVSALGTIISTIVLISEMTSR